MLDGFLGGFVGGLCCWCVCTFSDSATTCLDETADTSNGVTSERTGCCETGG